MADYDIVKAKKKSALIVHLKNAETPETRKWRRELLESVVTHDEMIDWTSEGGLDLTEYSISDLGTKDHDLLDGLTDDDHTQYILANGTRELSGNWGTGNTYGITELSHIDFYTSYAGGHQEGRVHWNDDDGTVAVGMPGGNVELQVGQEMLVRCRNVSGVTIDNGKVVKIVGATGNKPQIELATTTNSYDGYSAIGVATEQILNNSNGYVTISGLVRDMDTDSWNEGDPLYLTGTGSLTNVYPTPPAVLAHIAVVITKHATEGVILVTPRIVPPMTLLADTQGTPSSDGDFYTWDQTTDTRFELDNTGNYVLRSDWLHNGFVDDANELDISWDDGTMTLTISPAVTSFRYFYEGVMTTETGSLSATITDTEGLWAFYIGSSGAASLSTIHNPSEAQVEDAILNQCIVAYVYWDATNNDGRLLYEAHGYRMSPETHHYLHETAGAKYRLGMTLGDITTDQNGTSDAHAQFSITAGQFYDEDLQHTTLAHASTDTWELYYVNGSGDVRWTDCEATFPVYAIGGVIAYNNAGTLTAASVGKYVLYHVFATNIHTDSGGDYYPVVTPGVAQYNTKSAAQDAALTEIQQIDFGDWPVEEVIPIATVIYLHGAAMSNGVEAAIQSTDGGDDFVDWRYTAVSGSSTSVNDHGTLSGLSDDDHTQYLLADGTRALTADWDAGSFKITAETLESDVATGTAPLTVASTTVVTNLNADKLDGNDAADIDYSFVSGNDAATDVSASELEELSDGSTTTLHDHDVTGLTNWPTIDYSYVSGNDAATDVTAAQLEELSDGSTTTLHDHDVTGLTNWPTIDYSYVSGNDAATDVTASQLEELSDGSTTTLHDHDVTGLTNWPTIDYSYVSGNDAATDVSAAELETLTDTSNADALHAHDHGSIDGLTDDDHTQYLLADGTRALSGDWNAGATRTISAESFEAEASGGYYLEPVATKVQALDNSGTSTELNIANNNDWTAVNIGNGNTVTIYLKTGASNIFYDNQGGDLFIGDYSVGADYTQVESDTGNLLQVGDAYIDTEQYVNADEAFYGKATYSNYSKSMSNNVSQNFFKWGTGASAGDCMGYRVDFTLKVEYVGFGPTTYYWTRSGYIDGQMLHNGTNAYGASTTGVVWKGAAQCRTAAGTSASPTMNETVAQGAGGAVSTLGPYFFVNLTGAGLTYTSGSCSYYVRFTGDADISYITLF